MYPQAKLVSVLNGLILDVIVDIRKDSPTFGEHVSVILEAFDGKTVFIPEGYAHGFKTLSDGNNVVSYKTTNIYYPNDAYIIAWNDLDIGIDWLFTIEELQQCTKDFDINKIIKISDQDKNARRLNEIDKNICRL